MPPVAGAPNDALDAVRQFEDAAKSWLGENRLFI
jgi:hypothetical protein